MKPRILTDANGFADAVRERRTEMGMTHAETDHRTGLTEAHTSKIECFDRPWGKRVFNMTPTADLILQALGLAVVVMDREEALALTEASQERRIKLRSEGRTRTVRHKVVGWLIRYPANYPRS